MRKGLWSPDEDERLAHCISLYKHGSWSDIAQKAGLDRCGKSCRRRWMNHLRPNLKRGPFTPDEVKKVVELHVAFGNSRWSEIAAHMVGRTDNDVKNFWNTQVKRHLKACMKEGGKVDIEKLVAMASTTRSDARKNRGDDSNIMTKIGNSIKPQLNHSNTAMPRIIFADFIPPCEEPPHSHILVDTLLTHDVPPLLSDMPNTHYSLPSCPTPSTFSCSNDLTPSPSNLNVSCLDDFTPNSENSNSWMYTLECSPSSSSSIGIVASDCHFSPTPDSFFFEGPSTIPDICWAFNPGVNIQPFAFNVDTDL